MNVIIPPVGLPIPEWYEGDGPTPYVFSSLPYGHRCAWSCKWVADGAVITPLAWSGVVDPKSMDDMQIVAELEDLSFAPLMQFHAASAHKILADNLAGKYWRRPAEKLLTQARPAYLEYRISTRPGWADLAARPAPNPAVVQAARISDQLDKLTSQYRHALKATTSWERASKLAGEIRKLLKEFDGLKNASA